MTKIITDKTMLRCSKGTTPMPITVTSQQFKKIDDLLVATEVDLQPIVNIPCFGACMQKSPPQPCVPAPINWNKTSSSLVINDLKCLTQNSILKCSLGGVISVLSPSQTFFEEG